MDPRLADQHLRRLRQHRGLPSPDLSLGFVRDYFKRHIQRPHKQLGAVRDAWVELVPQPLQQRAVLESFSRGVLRVGLASSADLYELDRLLRGGLRQELARRCAGLRRVALRIAPRPPI